MTVPQQGYYVQEGGKVCDVTVPPAGCHFSSHAKPAFNEVWIVDSKHGEILEEYILHPTLESLAATGVDVSAFIVPPSAR